LWTKPVGNRLKKVALIDNLATLKQLKILVIQNNGKTIREGTLGTMFEMDTLSLTLTEMENLPGDMCKMSKLRRLSLRCSHLVQMESSFCDLQNLRSLKLMKCDQLEELPHLHMLKRLRKLEIVGCPMLRKLPKEFGGSGAFPSLEILSLSFLSGLEELPVVEEAAMPLLQVFTIMWCPQLEILSDRYLNLKTFKKLRIYGNSVLIKNLENHKTNKKIDVVTMSEVETESAEQAFVNYIDGPNSAFRMYGTETWGSELFQSYCFSWISELF
jgi:hypothetical protein